MMPYILLIVLLGVVLCGLHRWFAHVRMVMEERSEMVEVAARQYYESSRRLEEGDPDPETEAVCHRSLQIYQQAIELYEAELDKPFYRFAAHIMGFRDVR